MIRLNSNDYTLINEKFNIAAQKKINSNNIKDIGLLTGNAGIVIFLSYSFKLTHGF